MQKDAYWVGRGGGDILYKVRDDLGFCAFALCVLRKNQKRQKDKKTFWTTSAGMGYMATAGLHVSATGFLEW